MQENVMLQCSTEYKLTHERVIIIICSAGLHFVNCYNLLEVACMFHQNVPLYIVTYFINFYDEQLDYL